MIRHHRNFFTVRYRRPLVDPDERNLMKLTMEEIVAIGDHALDDKATREDMIRETAEDIALIVNGAAGGISKPSIEGVIERCQEVALALGMIDLLLAGDVDAERDETGDLIYFARGHR